MSPLRLWSPLLFSILLSMVFATSWTSSLTFQKGNKLPGQKRTEINKLVREFKEESHDTDSSLFHSFINSKGNSDDPQSSKNKATLIKEDDDNISAESEWSYDGDRSKTVSGLSFDEKIFNCSSCICTRTHYSDDVTMETTANCSSLNLRSIPRTLPADVIFINMSFNDMREFNTSMVSIYPRLKELDLRQNRIRQIFGNTNDLSTNIPTGLLHLNLYYNRIICIQDGAFKSFSNLIFLQLSFNSLGNITKNAFNGLESLIHLDMSKNNLKYIDDESFDVLTSLKKLYLNNNPYLGYAQSRMRPRIFQKLKSVTSFHIHGCSNGNRYYPNEVFNQMPHLEELSIDGIDSPLFSKPMNNLYLLSFGRHSRCMFKNITSKLVQNTPNLRSLAIRYCNFNGIDEDLFSLIPHLETLFLQHITTFDLTTAFEALQSLQNSSLKVLKLVHLYHGVNCRVLCREQGKYIEHIKLETLDLSDNCISLLQDDFLHAIPRTVKRLILSKNRFSITGNIWNRIPFLINLNELDVSNQNNDWRTYISSDRAELADPLSLESSYNYDVYNMYPSTYNPSKDYATLSLSLNNIIKKTNLGSKVNRNRNAWRDSQMGGLTNEYSYIPNEDEVDSECQDRFSDSSTEKVKQLLPPNLRTVKASMYIGFGDLLLHMSKRGPNKLTNLFFSNSFMSSFGKGNLPCNVQDADFSHNQCSVLLPQFFSVNNSLLRFKIRNNQFGVPFAEDLDGDIFSRLNKLRHLDISSNNIFSLSDKFLRGLSELTTLDLSENKLRVFNLSLSHIKSIKFIDVSKNSIYFISEGTRDDLDIIASYHHLEVDFRDNSFPCTCDGLPILKWMSKTKVSFKKYLFLTCINSNGHLERIGNVSLRLDKLQRECESKIDLLIVSCMVGVVFFLFIVTALMYKNRWKLRYMKNCFLAKWLGFHPKQTTKSSFKFDAFVVHDQEDQDFVFSDVLVELENNRGHKLCVEDRNFIPGTFTTNNIVCALQNSTVTVLVISPASLTSPDIEYVIQMALLEEYYSDTKRDVLHLIMYKDTGEMKLPVNLLALLRKGRFLEFPLNDDNDITVNIMQGFWDQLSHIIGHTSDIDRHPRLDPE